MLWQAPASHFVLALQFSQATDSTDSVRGTVTGHIAAATVSISRGIGVPTVTAIITVTADCHGANGVVWRGRGTG